MRDLLCRDLGCHSDLSIRGATSQGHIAARVSTGAARGARLRAMDPDVGGKVLGSGAERPDHAWVGAHPDRWGLRFDDAGAWLRGVALAAIADAVGTPTYVYDAAGIRERFAAVRDALTQRALGGGAPLVCYAMKANSSQAILHLLAREGAGADIVSGGELERALAAGIPPERILFSGVGKTDAELDAAIAAEIRAINVESVDELGRLSERAAALGRVAPVCLRINPDVDPDTHPYLATGLRESKFGIAMADGVALGLRAHHDPNIELVGIACHIGSQICDAAPFEDSIARLRETVSALRQHHVVLRHLDVGGGLGIAYGPGDPQLDIAAWGAAVAAAAAGLDLQLVVEPGRYLVADAGILLTRVIGRKRNEVTSFVIVDAAMNDLLRPALYQAHHAIVPARLPGENAPLARVDVVGPVCESGDFLARDRLFPAVERGDLLLVLDAGAYGMSMASTYNTRPLPAEVLVDNGRCAVIRPRKSVAQLIAEEQLPSWW